MEEEEEREKRGFKHNQRICIFSHTFIKTLVGIGFRELVIDICI